jgi:aryl-alcohol dehydrogenase-like predicted oxidoreductase
VRYRRLDGTDLTISEVGLGGNNFHARLDEGATRAVVDAALESGVNFFDTADIYGAAPGGGEELLGKALRAVRSDVVLATKFGMDLGASAPNTGLARGSGDYIVRSAEDSLRRLGTEYIDLYQYHEPDGRTPVEVTLAALDRLVQSGKVRHAGCSNFTETLLREGADAACRQGVEGFVSVQSCYHLLNRSVESDVVPACLERRIALLPYYPLANGLLTGKYARGEPAPAGSRMSWRTSWFTDAALERVEELGRVADELGVGLLQLAIGWLLAQPAVACVVTGAMSADQIAANVAASDWLPPPEALSAVDRVVAPGTKVL